MKTTTSIFKSFAYLTTLTALLSACGGGVLDGGSSSKTKVLWDGETISSGGKWTNVNQKDLDTITMEVNRSEGFSGSNSLQIQAAGDGYMGVGWNWLDQWEDSQGENIAGYENINLMVKFTGKKFPKIYDISFQIASGGQPGARAKAVGFGIGAPENTDVMDGQWHKLSFPLSLFDGTANPGSPKIDLFKAREFAIGINPREYVDFDILIDDVTLSK